MDLDHESDKEQMTQNAGFGELPSRAPLANPYVPYQMPNPPTYPAKNGIVRGTMFPGLDLPFMGMVNTTPLSETSLHELQTLCFAVLELGEYLDTHQDDMEAFELFPYFHSNVTVLAITKRMEIHCEVESPQRKPR